MAIGLDEPFHYDIAYAELRPGWWVADVDVPALKLQVMDHYMVAISGDDAEYQAIEMVRRMIWRIHHPTIAQLN